MIARRATVALLSIMVMVVVGSSSCGFVYYPAQLSSAQIVAAGSPELRTLDNTGFVYPGGYTAEVSQGIAPAVYGRGAYLTAPPTRGRMVSLAGPRVAGLAEGPLSPSTSSGADAPEAVGRVARALCDHAASCERIGPGGAFESADACSTEERAQLGGVVANPGCATTVRGDLLAECLRAIRGAQCIVNADASSMPAPCAEALQSCP